MRSGDEADSEFMTEEELKQRRADNVLRWTGKREHDDTEEDHEEEYEGRVGARLVAPVLSTRSTVAGVAHW